jgi:hypothetical protein
MLKRYALVVVLLVGVGGAIAAAQSVTKETLPGVTNFARLETTIACAGATTPQAVAGLKQMGYAAIINLREASEAGADIDAGSRRRRRPPESRSYTCRSTPPRRIPRSLTASSRRSPTRRNQPAFVTAPAVTAPPRCG